MSQLEPNQMFKIEFELKDRVQKVDQDSFVYEVKVSVEDVMLEDKRQFKVKKQFQQFLDFQNRFKKELKQDQLGVFDFIGLEQSSFKGIYQSTSLFVKQKEKIQCFLKNFKYNHELITTSFMQFMEFPDDIVKIVDRKGPKQEQENEEISDDKFQNFFVIKYMNQITDINQTQIFRFEIRLQNYEPKLKWIINKRYNDFRFLYKQFQLQKIVDIPSLPSKIYNSRRSQELLLFLKIVANTRKYQTQQLFDFLYDDVQQQKIDLQRYCLQNGTELSLSLNCFDYEKILKGDKQVTYYKIQVQELDKEGNISNERFVMKRFKEFYEFNQILCQMQTIFYGKQKLYQLLPSKFNKNEGYRQQQLHVYLENVSKLKNISTNYVFLSFLSFVSSGKMEGKNMSATKQSDHQDMQNYSIGSRSRSKMSDSVDEEAMKFNTEQFNRISDITRF